MKKYLLLFVAAALLVGLNSCEKNSAVEKKSETPYNVITDQAILSQYLVPVNQAVEFKGANAGELSYTWVYNVNADAGYSASAVDGYEDAVYVGWHTRGVQYLGAIQTINIEDPENPYMAQNWLLANSEVNDLEYKSNVDRLFVAGAAGATESGESVGDDNAMAIGVDVLSNGNIDVDGSDFWMDYFYGSSANSVTYVPNQTVWLSTGSRGGLTVFRDYDRTDIEVEIEAANSKHFDATGDYGVLLSGTGFNESVLRVWDMNNFTNFYNPNDEFTIPFDVTPQGKNAVDINYNFAYLAMGNDGVVKVNLDNGEVVNQYDRESGAFCNGVAVDFRYVYAAYGADGLYVLDKETFELVGYWDFDGSCNYVKKVGDFLFLANGDTDGMIMLKKD